MRSVRGRVVWVGRCGVRGMGRCWWEDGGRVVDGG